MADKQRIINNMNAKLEAAGLPDRVSLNPPGSPATYGYEGPCMVAGYSSAAELNDLIDLIVKNVPKPASI